MKQCTSCKEIKPKEQFLKDNKNKDGLRYECKPCHNLRNRLWHKNNKERGKNNYLKRLYGITLQEKLKMAKLQNNKCAICNKEFVEEVDICVDHNHDTGVIRQLLCNPCNRGLGQFQDSAQILKSAIMYLNKHAKKEAA